MKTKTATLLLLCMLLSCAGANVANAGKQNREVGTFRKIQVSSGIDLYFTQEKPQSVRVEIENVDENDVITEVKNETLVVKMKDRYNWGINMKRQTIKVYVSAPVLEGISTSGGSDFYADNLKSTDFSIATSGGSDLRLGNLSVDGRVDIATSGGSDCNIKNLKANACKIAASGGSDTKIRMEVTGELSIGASGASDVKLSGTAGKVSISASGASDVNVRQLEYKEIDSKSSGRADIHK
jgi:hypothetical protein